MRPEETTATAPKPVDLGLASESRSEPAPPFQAAMAGRLRDSSLA
jgi:hypothetical protein